MTSLRLIFQTGCVDPKHLINVPFIQVQDPDNENKVAAYVTFDKIKSLPRYRISDYGSPVAIACDLLRSMMKA